MKVLTYVDETNFEKTEQQFDDFHYELADNIKDYIHDRYETDLNLAKSTEILSNKEGDKLIIGLIKNRLNDEEISEKYRITIEKI